jgi:hypothetical protein
VKRWTNGPAKIWYTAATHLFHILHKPFTNQMRNEEKLSSYRKKRQRELRRENKELLRMQILERYCPAIRGERRE